MKKISIVLVDSYNNETIKTKETLIRLLRLSEDLVKVKVTLTIQDGDYAISQEKEYFFNYFIANYDRIQEEIDALFDHLRNKLEYEKQKYENRANKIYSLINDLIKKYEKEVL